MSDQTQIRQAQIRAARALLHLDQTEVAERAGTSVVTIRRLEAGYSGVTATTLDRIRQVLEQAGVEFIPGGVRRRPTTRPDATALLADLQAISRRSAQRLQDRAGDQPVFSEDDLYDENGLPA
jgi:transcriptional regulator with XRE-family HTH domain